MEPRRDIHYVMLWKICLKLNCFYFLVHLKLLFFYVCQLSITTTERVISGLNCHVEQDLLFFNSVQYR